MDIIPRAIIEPPIAVAGALTIILTHTIAETSVTLFNQTVYGEQSRSDYASLMYVNNKKTTGDSPIIITPINPISDNEWVLTNLCDGYYKSELLLVPTFELVNTSASVGSDILMGTIVYYNGVFYRAVKTISNDGDFPTPDVDYNNWEAVDTNKIENVYNEAVNASLPVYAQTFYGFTEFVFYNNLIYAFLNLSAEITKSCNICANPQIEALRCLRDKYESVELAVAAGNYSGAQTIIESSQNLVNSCSC